MKTTEAKLGDPNFCENWKRAELAVAEARRTASKGDLYFVRVADAVKIGRSVNILSRLGKMQADNHQELNCLLVVPDRGRDEPIWHQRFRHLHIRGEWFAWADDLAAAIEDLRAERLTAIANERAAA